jgi:UDP-glucuronate 4-epimerase
MKLVVTGVAGFIGSSTALRLLSEGHTILGIDNFSADCERSLMESRLARIENKRFIFEAIDIGNFAAFRKAIEGFQPDAIVHLAAQVGVRRSEEVPHLYLHSNVTGFLNVLETCRALKVMKLIYASSSSVYGEAQGAASSENAASDPPISFYAATKRSTELMAHSYSHLYGIETTGLRFFTVYGPWGRPDMAYYSFASSILGGKPITLFREGHHGRDFTYVDDVTETISRVLNHHMENAATIFNVGTGNTISLKTMVSLLERYLDKTATVVLAPRRASDVIETRANPEKLRNALGWCPTTAFEIGIARFVTWFSEYHQSSQSLKVDFIDHSRHPSSHEIISR